MLQYFAQQRKRCMHAANVQETNGNFVSALHLWYAGQEAARQTGNHRRVRQCGRRIDAVRLRIEATKK